MNRIFNYLLLVLLPFIALRAAKADTSIDRSRSNDVQIPNGNAMNRVSKLQAPKQSDIRKQKIPKKTLGTLALSAECRDDVERICSHNQKLSSNLEVLSCLTNSREDDEDLSPDCQHYLWNFKLNITKDPKFEQVAREMCKKTIDENEECLNTPLHSGKLIPCLLLYKDKAQPRQCYNFLVKMATIIYSDYRLICDFVEDCGEDINRFKCGKVDSAAADDTSEPHSQGAVVACLQDNIVSGSNVQEKCAKQIVRLSELSSDDFHLDRHLYFKCKDDRERMCEEVVAGEGKVYKCLFNHKFDHQMSPECREALTLRQKLVAHDFKSSYNLHMICGAEIEQNDCLTNPTYKTDGINDHNDFIGLSGVLLCLEDTKLSGKTIDERCEAELSEYRRMLSEDYELSPEIVKGCAKEITKNCNGGIKKHGETIHCLMALAKKPDFSSSCETAIMHLLKENEEAADYRMDYALAKACNPVVSTACSDFHEGDPMILSCLMDHLHTEVMTIDCRKRLLEMQYFISRDFFLDPVFFKKCSADAKRICEISDLKKIGNEEMTMPYSLVISCLYRHIPSTRSHKKQEKKKETSHECTEEVYKVIHNRALDFDLNPELDRACRPQLGQFCSDNLVERGSEVLCLQDHFENITNEECRSEIEKITEIEDKDADKVDNILLRACQPEVETYCKDVLDEDDEGRVMECLIEHKQELNHDCSVGITHFQLIEMKDIHFSYTFMRDCENDIHDRCPHLEQGVHTKNDVVLCLSKINRDSAVGQDEPLSEQCANQLTVENFQKHEDVRFNPELTKSCQKDMQTICHDVKPGQARMVQCLRSHRNKLTVQCRSHLFGVEEEEAKNRKLDFMLMRTCKPAIKEWCQMHMSSGDVGLILDCLITHKDLLDSGCREIVVQREGEEYSDINLDPVLHEACGDDIKNKCQDDLKRQEDDEKKGNPLVGKVINCLKREAVNPSDGEELSKKCLHHVRFIMKEAANDFSLDPMLALRCINSINNYCPPSRGNVVECLKNSYFKGQLKKDQECTVEVARMLREGRSDVMADPILHGACSNDIVYQCPNVPEGQGRIMSCLLHLLDDSNKSLAPNCREILMERRKMWSYAAMNGVEDFKGLSNIVMESSGKTYLLTVITIFLLCIMLLGVLCGRVTKRVSRQRKML